MYTENTVVREVCKSSRNRRPRFEWKMLEKIARRKVKKESQTKDNTLNGTQMRKLEKRKNK